MNHSPWGPPVGEGFSDSTRQHGGFSPGFIVIAWLGSYLVANVLAVAVQLLAGSGDLTGVDVPTWAFALAAVALWIPNLAMLVIVSHRRGTGNFSHDFSFRFGRRDLLGIPIGIVSQLLLVGIVTWPFRQMFPGSFSSDNIDKRATSLVDAAHGYWIVLLTVVVALGAPVVEELVFRGFIQGGLQQRFRQITALVIGAIWFTVVHVNPVEFPGLFAFALVLGLCFMKTKRLGMSMWAHVAFNATALVLVIIQ